MKTRNYEYSKELESYQCGMEFSAVWIYTYLYQQSQIFSIWLSCSRIHSKLYLQVETYQVLHFILQVGSWLLFESTNFMTRMVESHFSTISKWFGMSIGNCFLWCFQWCYLDGLCYHTLEVGRSGIKLRHFSINAMVFGGRICYLSIISGFLRL